MGEEKTGDLNQFLDSSNISNNLRSLGFDVTPDVFCQLLSTFI